MTGGAKAILGQCLVAVLLGQAIFFLFLMPRLPAWAQHRPLRLDPGLLIDFIVSSAVFFSIRLCWRR